MNKNGGKPAAAQEGRKPTRHSCRSQAFQILYGLHFTPVENELELRRAYYESPDVRDRLQEELPAGAPGMPALPPEPQGYAWELVSGVWQHREELSRTLSEISQNWRIERIGRIELTLLQIALFEMLYRPDVPPNAAINEAVALAKEFGEEGSKIFINGILDAFAKEIKSGKRSPGWTRA